MNHFWTAFVGAAVGYLVGKLLYAFFTGRILIHIHRVKESDDNHE